MRLVTSIALLSWLAASDAAHSQQGQGQPPQAGHWCEPWPACAVTQSPLVPGAPSPGLRPQDQTGSENIFSGQALTNKRIDRGTLRLPELTK